MIFIGIIDPSIGDSKELVETHIKWCREYCAKLDEPFIVYQISGERCAESFMEKLYNIICNEENWKNTIYLYYFCHGIQKGDKEYIQLSPNVLVEDYRITRLYFNNRVKYLTVFYECCHGQGLYEPDALCYIPPPKTLWNVNISHHAEGSKLQYYRNNITVICTSLSTEISLVGLRNDMKLVSLATDTLKTLGNMGYNPNPFFNPVKTVVNFVNNMLRGKTNGKQNMTVNSPNLLINWFG